MENILLISPRLNDQSIKYENYPSSALVLIGTMLYNRGYNVKILHMLADSITLPELRKKLFTFKPKIVGITMNTLQTRSAKEISRIVKEVDKDTLVVVGGPHPSALKQKIFNFFPHVDVSVVGEGEQTFLEIVEGKDLREIKGICYREDSHVKVNTPRPLAKDLDYIPLPRLELIDISRYRGFRDEYKWFPHPSMVVMGSRGCPFHCTYCSNAVFGNTARFRKPELIIEEIRWLNEKYGIKGIYFLDDTFNLNKKWAKEVFNLIIDNKLNNLVYKVSFRANEKLVDEELLQLAKDAGVKLIFYGVESGNQEMLDRMRKNLTLKEIKRAFELTHKIGLMTRASFIIGLPGETKDTIRDSLKLIKEIKSEYAGCGFAVPFPGTEFESEVLKKGHLLVTDYDEFIFYDRCFTRTDSLTSEDLVNLHSYVQTFLSEEKFKRFLRERAFKEIIVEGFRHPRRALQVLWRLIKISSV